MFDVELDVTAVLQLGQVTRFNIALVKQDVTSSIVGTRDCRAFC